jgi:hypothetical protein
VLQNLFYFISFYFIFPFNHFPSSLFRNLFSHYLPLHFFLQLHLSLVIFSRSPEGPDWPKAVPQLQHTDHTCGTAGSLQEVCRAGVAVNNATGASQPQQQGCRWTERDHRHKGQHTTDHQLPSGRSFASKIAIQGKFYSA